MGLQSADTVARRKASVRARSAALRKAGVPTQRDAISAFCADCIYDPGAAGTWRAQVKACESRACPLWPYRPGSNPVVEMKNHEAVTVKTILKRKREIWKEV